MTAPNGLVEGVESLLFVADSPATLRMLADALEATEAETLAAIERLSARLSQGSGLQIIQIAGGYQFCTRPAYARAVARFLQPQRQRMSRAALETLAVVAYRQPVTLGEMESLRGVNCDGVVRNLVERGFVHEVGRKSAPGRPILYGTTPEFLHQFGLRQLQDLPPLQDEPLAEAVP